MKLIRFAASLSALSMAIAGASVAHADSPRFGYGVECYGAAGIPGC